MKTWNSIGLFKDEESAKTLTPKFFADAEYEAHFSDACNFGYKDDNRIMLIVNYKYWLSKIDVSRAAMGRVWEGEND